MSKKQELVIYRSKDGGVQLDATLEKETIWLTQKQMGLLFEKDTDTIGLHIRNAYKEGELEEVATTEESSVVQQEGKRKVRRKPTAGKRGDRRHADQLDWRRKMSEKLGAVNRENLKGLGYGE